MKLDRCNNISDLREMARKRLPGPIFNYPDGAADDEWSLKRNTAAFPRHQLARMREALDITDLGDHGQGEEVLDAFVAGQALNRGLISWRRG